VYSVVEITPGLICPHQQATNRFKAEFALISSSNFESIERTGEVDVFAYGSYRAFGMHGVL
jgi:hypothetical protein